MEEAERFLIDGILPSKPNQIFKMQGGYIMDSWGQQIFEWMLG
jgi:hypothetical protein